MASLTAAIRNLYNKFFFFLRLSTTLRKPVHAEIHSVGGIAYQSAGRSLLHTPSVPLGAIGL